MLKLIEWLTKRIYWVHHRVIDRGLWFLLGLSWLLQLVDFVLYNHATWCILHFFQRRNLIHLCVSQYKCDAQCVSLLQQRCFLLNSAIRFHQTYIWFIVHNTPYFGVFCNLDVHLILRYCLYLVISIERCWTLVLEINYRSCIKRIADFGLLGRASFHSISRPNLIFVNFYVFFVVSVGLKMDYAFIILIRFRVVISIEL